jgi:hypothetical protein
MFDLLERRPSSQAYSPRPRRHCGPESPDSSDEFTALVTGYRTSGGLVSAEALALDGGPQWSIGAVARGICERQLVSIHWAGTYWFPVFQFQRGTTRPGRDVQAVLDQLCPVLDDWQVAGWFARPSELLDAGRPADALTFSPDAVLQAARALHFALRG